MLAGLEDLNRRVAGQWPEIERFSGLATDQQDAMLHAIEGSAFFEQVLEAVIVGTFGHPQWGGNQDQVGWRMIGFQPRYRWLPPFGAYDEEVHRR